MKLTPLQLGVIAVGGVLLLFPEAFSALGEALGLGPKAPPPAPSSGRTTNLSAPDPITAGILALTPAIEEGVNQLADSDSDLRRNLKKGGNVLQEGLSRLGLARDPRRREKKKKQQAANVTEVRVGVEKFAAAAHAAMSRPDTREWVVDSVRDKRENVQPLGGEAIHPHVFRISVYFRNVKEPTVFVVPQRMTVVGQAFVAEPIARVTGGFTQRGGRLPGPWFRYTDPDGGWVPAFSDANPFATPTDKIGNILALSGTPEATLTRAKGLKRRLPSKQARSIDLAALSGLPQRSDDT